MSAVPASLVGQVAARPARPTLPDKLLREAASLLEADGLAVSVELGRLLADLRSRLRVCAHCGAGFLQKSRHRRPRAFCSDTHRAAANRAARHRAVLRTHFSRPSAILR